MFFALCRYVPETVRYTGFEVWDQTTGQRIKLFSGIRTSPYASINLNRNKLQWLPDSKLLLVSSDSDAIPSWLSLFDVRADAFVGAKYTCDNSHVLIDIVAMDNCYTLWIVDMTYRLGFLDIRVNSRNSRENGIQWGSPGDVLPIHTSLRGDQARSFNKSFEQRPACWGSHLFASVCDSVHVLSSRDWQAGSCTLSGTVKTVNGGDIIDTAVGGDRLFILHNKSDSFEVWETRRDKGSFITAQY